MPENEATCIRCNDIVNVLDARSNNSRHLCYNCIDNHGVDFCRNCSDLTSHPHYADVTGYNYCEECYTDIFGYCDECDNLYYNSDMIDMVCNGCNGENSERNIRGYHDNPPYKYHHNSTYSDSPLKGEYYLGLEVELEGARAIIAENIGAFPSLWACDDSSVRNGAEIISHPATLNALNNGNVINWDNWTRLIHNQVPNQNQYHNNGIHVHVSRTAFHNAKGSRSAAHMYKFLMFIQKHESAMQYLAGRENNSYAAWDGPRDILSRKKEAESKEDYTERYRPVNTNPRDTIEIRFFDGRSDPKFIRKSYQIVAAIVEFTRNKHSHDDMSWVAFTKFVHSHKSSYADLDAHLKSASITLEKLATRSTNAWKRSALPALKRETKRVRDIQARRARRRTSTVRRGGECCEYCTTYGP